MKKKWKHKSKYNGKQFFGFYSTLEDSDLFKPERVFNLKQLGGKKTYTFESWQMAKKLGWVKI